MDHGGIDVHKVASQICVIAEGYLNATSLLLSMISTNRVAGTRMGGVFG